MEFSSGWVVMERGFAGGLCGRGVFVVQFVDRVGGSGAACAACLGGRGVFVVKFVDRVGGSGAACVRPISGCERVSEWSLRHSPDIHPFTGRVRTAYAFA